MTFLSRRLRRGATSYSGVFGLIAGTGGVIHLFGRWLTVRAQPVWFPTSGVRAASIPSAATRIPCACSCRNGRSPQPCRVAHSRTLRCRPTTCHTQLPAGLPQTAQTTRRADAPTTRCRPRARSRRSSSCPWTLNQQTPKGNVAEGVMGATGAVGNAANDALAPYEVVTSTQPFSPHRLHAFGEPISPRGTSPGR